MAFYMFALILLLRLSDLALLLRLTPADKLANVGILRLLLKFTFDIMVTCSFGSGPKGVKSVVR